MEYLMTYGWAILIIAVVLGVLFNIGVFNGAGALGTSCVAYSGFLCSSPILSHTTGNLIVTIGQNTGTNWASANIVFVPQGSTTSGGVPQVSSDPQISSFNSMNTFNGGSVGGAANVLGSFNSGQSQSVTLVTGQNSGINTGTLVSGAIWAAYTVSGSSSVYYVQMATANLKAV
jgi:hypothetical protein